MRYIACIREVFPLSITFVGRSFISSCKSSKAIARIIWVEGVRTLLIELRPHSNGAFLPLIRYGRIL